MLPKREFGCDTIVDAIKQSAWSVDGGNGEAVVVALLIAVAVGLHACNFSLNCGYGDVEVVVATLTGAATFPTLDVPVPVLGDGYLARDGTGEGRGCKNGKSCERNHFRESILVFAKVDDEC